MISHERFGSLRLAQYLDGTDIEILDHWEYEGRAWIGEAHGFSEWLRLECDPEVLRALSLDFQTFPTSAAERVLGTLELAVRSGTELDGLRAALGNERAIHHFAGDRVTYEFNVLSPVPYVVSCTVLNIGGLTYLTIMVPLSAEPA